MKYDCKDLNLADTGKKRIEWAEERMPVLRMIRKRFEEEKPLDGLKIAACLHVTTETANLMQTLKAGGATVALCASNPLSTQDDVVASLVKHDEVSVFAIKGEDNERYYSHIHSVLDIKSQVTLDDGADLVSTLHIQTPTFGAFPIIVHFLSTIIFVINKTITVINAPNIASNIPVINFIAMVSLSIIVKSATTRFLTFLFHCLSCIET